MSQTAGCVDFLARLQPVQKSIAAVELIQKGWYFRRSFFGYQWHFLAVSGKSSLVNYDDFLGIEYCAFSIHGYDELMEYVGTFHPRSITICPSNPWNKHHTQFLGSDKGKFWWKFLYPIAVVYVTLPSLQCQEVPLAGPMGWFWGFFRGYVFCSGWWNRWLIFSPNGILLVYIPELSRVFIVLPPVMLNHKFGAMEKGI